MWVVPLPTDIITTTDDQQYEVKHFSNYKAKGPCALVKPVDGTTEQLLSVYFFDIKLLNDVEVDFPQGPKVLNSLGVIKRTIQLPQKHDELTIFDSETETSKKVKVKELKLHNKNIGLSKGLVVISDDGDRYSLRAITAIERDSGDSFFDKKKFQKIYAEYLGHESK
jgi:hypothetical protein